MSLPLKHRYGLVAADGRRMHAFAAGLYPDCRSITGDGVRRLLNEIRKHIPLVTSEVPTGSSVFDWTVPKEWNVTEAYIRNSAGERVVDFAHHSLHLMSYSVPVYAPL